MAFLGLSKGDNIGGVLDRHKGIGPGFDVLRILLAMAIVYYHTMQISGASGGIFVSFWGNPHNLIRTIHQQASGAGTGQGGFVGISRPFHIGLVPAFFALSGFLVIGSAFRLRQVSTFLAFRFFRIFPALIVEVTLSALVLGPIFTNLPLVEYFTSPMLYRYILNSIGWITFELPGVFFENPWQQIVNANLWTLPSEFDCYFLTAILMMTGLIYDKRKFSICYIIAYACLTVANTAFGFDAVTGNMTKEAITFYFFTGIFLYHWRYELPASLWLGTLSAVIVWLGLLRGNCQFVVAPFLAYVIALFGMLRIPNPKPLSNGDYSYGVYLYAFPIAQALIAGFPSVFVGRGAMLTAMTFVCAFLFAAFSWHVIEKPALALKRNLPPRFFPVPRRVIPQSPEGRAAVPEGPEVTLTVPRTTS